MHDIFKIHFHVFSREHAIGSHMQFTRNCGNDFDDRKYIKGRNSLLANATIIIVSVLINFLNWYRRCSNTSMKLKNDSELPTCQYNNVKNKKLAKDYFLSLIALHVFRTFNIYTLDNTLIKGYMYLNNRL